MTLVQGELRLVTDTPAEVSQVWIQASKERLHGTGMVTDGRASEQVKNGVVSFNALPGAAVMVLLVNGIPSLTVKLLIPDKANATLRECIEAVKLADDGTLSALEALALQIAGDAAKVGTAAQVQAWATEAKQSETNSKQSESNASAAADSAADSAAAAKTAETNARAHEASALSSAERAEFAAEETIQQVEGDFATRNYVDNQVQPLEDDLSSAVTYINGTGADAGKLLRLRQDGKLRVLTSSITEPTDVANKNYVDTSWSRFPRATGDLNNIRTPGVYKLATLEAATPENNYPESRMTGILEVYAIGDGSSYPFQRVTTRSATPRIYIRMELSKGWGKWQTFTSDEEFNAERYAQEFPTLNPDEYYAPAGQKLTLPTHDGSGQATHPSVLHFPGGFNGYQYWMAVTPFPYGNDSYEDPDILASHDGTTWVVPDGLTNPLDDAPGNPDYNSDTCLSMGPNNTMWCFWRLRGASTGAEVIYGRSTTDGVTWTPREEIIRNDDADGKLNRLLSPSLVYDSRGAGSWRLWVINRSDATDGDWVKLKHSAGPTGWNFTDWQDVTVAPLQDRYRPWHMSVRYLEGKYVGILCASDSRVQATYDNLMVVGDSPTDFRASSMPSVERTSAQHTSLYQSSMVPVVTPDGVEWDVFYSGIYAPTNAWNVFRTRMRRRELGSLREFIEEKLTPPDSGWRDISDTLREGWTGRVRIRRIGWEIFIELNKVTRESGVDHRMINLPRFGFLPSFNIRRNILTSSQKPIELALYTWVGDLGAVHVTPRGEGDVLYGGFSFLTSDRPPSEWPGVPA